MSFPRYERYKDNGIEGLGEVPEHWKVKRLRFVALLNPSKSETAELDRETEVSFLPMEAIGNDGFLDLEHTRQIGEVETGYTYFREGDVTIAKITPCFENGKGAIMRGLLGGIGFGTTELVVARPIHFETASSYLHWIFISTPFRKLGQASMYGAGGQKRVSDDFVRNFAIGFPNLAEQKQISTFLDRETTKIDELISAQQRLIELLKEKRQAVISHAVTKGLNPEVPMKDSGIEWLGEVPEHWVLVALKRIASICYGIGEPPHYQEKGVPLIRATNVHNGYISEEGMVFVNPMHIPEKRIIWLLPGDIIVVRSGAYTGDSAIIPEGYTPCIAGFDMVLRCNGVLPSYIQFVLLSKYLKRNQIDLKKTRAAQPHLNAEELGSCLIVLPVSREEQIEITIFLESEVTKIDELISEAQRAITLLQERRTALISAAVTGKIDVRNRVAAEKAWKQKHE